MKQISIVAGLVVMTSCCTAVAAEQTINLDNIVVTATRTEKTADKVGGTSYTVITKDDLAAKQDTTVAKALKDVPGLNVVSNGGPGTTTSIFLRGADSKNTLVLVDGVVYNDPSSATRSANLANLTTDNIERIEIVRGPMSVLYGSNATAGVVNIITKDGQGPPKSRFGIEGGSYNTWKEFADSSGSIGRGSYSLSISRIDSDGFSNADAKNPLIPHAGNTSEKDGWRNTTFSGKAGFHLTPTFTIKAILRAMASTADLDDYGPGYIGDRFSSWPYSPEPNGRKDAHTDSDLYTGRIEADNAFLDKKLNSTAYVQFTRHNRTGYDNDGIESYDYRGESREAGLQGTYSLSATNDLTLGTSLYWESMKSLSSSIENKDTDTRSVWAQEQVSLFTGLDLTGGLRYDDHDKFGSKMTYRIAPSYMFGTGTTIKASYGTGFRAPSLFELYSVYGNEDLKPEESRGFDFGFEQDLSKDRVVIGATYFIMNFDDRIDYDFLTSSYQQATGETRTNGVESFVRLTPVPNLRIQVGYTYTHTEDPEGSPLVRIPKHKLTLEGRYRYGKALFDADLRWVGSRAASESAKDLYGNSVGSLDPYCVVNLATSYDLTDSLQVTAKIKNLFDEYYEEAWSYATPGRSIYLGLIMKI